MIEQLDKLVSKGVQDMNDKINRLQAENAELKSAVEAAEKRVSELERERNELVLLLSNFARSKEGKQYLYDNPTYEKASETLNNFAKQQQIKALEDFIPAVVTAINSVPVPEIDWDANMKMRNAIVNILDKATSNRIQQLRKGGE